MPSTTTISARAAVGAKLRLAADRDDQPVNGEAAGGEMLLKRGPPAAQADVVEAEEQREGKCSARGGSMSKP